MPAGSSDPVGMFSIWNLTVTLHGMFEIGFRFVVSEPPYFFPDTHIVIITAGCIPAICRKASPVRKEESTL